MASGVNFSGVGSNIDFSVITDAIISSKSRPISLLASKRSNISSQGDALKQLNAKLITLKSAAEGLNDRTLGTGLTVASSTSSTLTATVSSTASPNTVNVDVLRLATNLSQASKDFSSPNATILAGGAPSASFELRQGGATTGINFTISDANNNNSLTGLRDAINAADAGVTASIVDVSGDGTKNELVLSSTATGAAGRVELVETTSTGTATALNLRNLNPVSGDFSELNSSIKLNGLTISRPTNNITDAITGVNLDLKATGSSTITVTANTTAFKSKLGSFIDAYNDLQSFVSSQFTKDGNGKPTGILAKDSTLRLVDQQIREVATAVAGNNGGSFKQLSDIGITRKDDGKLALDQTVINDKLKSSFSDLQALFTGKTDGQKGLANSFTTLFDGLGTAADTAVKNINTSIQNINKNIQDQQARLEDLRTALTRRFSIADAAIGQLNSQSSSLTSILKGLENSKANS